jgi:hypothetical protein
VNCYCNTSHSETEFSVQRQAIHGTELKFPEINDQIESFTMSRTDSFLFRSEEKRAQMNWGRKEASLTATMRRRGRASRWRPRRRARQGLAATGPGSQLGALGDVPFGVMRAVDHFVASSDRGAGAVYTNELCGRRSGLIMSG